MRVLCNLMLILTRTLVSVLLASELAHSILLLYEKNPELDGRGARPTT